MRIAHIFNCIFIFSTLLVVELVPSAKSVKSPVIFVPGNGGSQMQAKLDRENVAHYLCTKKTDDFYSIWLNLELFLPILIDCWIDNIKLIYDNVTRTTSNAAGVEIVVPGWGDPFVVEYIDPTKAFPGVYFKDIGQLLVDNLGYERNVSLRAAPYDFRKAPNENEEFFLKFKDLVEETYDLNNNQPVTIIAHSMGSLMSTIFLQRQSQDWKDKYMKTMISLAGAFGGSVKALKIFATGDNLGSFLLQAHKLKHFEITYPSFGFLLPSKHFWTDQDILVYTPERNYTSHDFEQLFNDMDFPDAWEFRKDNEKYLHDLSEPGVELHCLHGSDVDTIERLLYNTGNLATEEPTLLFGDGDGSVNLKSLQGCLRWYGSPNTKVYYRSYPGRDHMDVLSDQTVLSYIQSILEQET